MRPTGVDAPSRVSPQGATLAVRAPRLLSHATLTKASTQTAATRHQTDTSPTRSLFGPLLSVTALHGTSRQNGTRRRMPQHTSGSDRAAIPPAARDGGSVRPPAPSTLDELWRSYKATGDE